MKKKSPGSTVKSPAKDRRKAVLEAVLAQIPFDGWTDESLAHGAKQAGLSRTETGTLFPNGIRDVIDYFGEQTDEAMQKRIDAERSFGRMRVREKISFAVRARLEHMTPHREAVRRLMMWYALPLNIPAGLKRMSQTVDLIWKAAGDTSEDFNFYTKRFLLAAVIKATILYWLDDETPGCEASWGFLDRRIGDVLKLGKSISLLKEFTPKEIIAEATGFLRRKMRA